MSGFMTIRMQSLHVLVLLTVCPIAFGEEGLESRIALPSDPRAAVIELFESRSGAGSVRAPSDACCRGGWQSPCRGRERCGPGIADADFGR